MKEMIGIIGAGAYGSALGHAFAASGRELCFWARSKDIVNEINLEHKNKKYMGDAEFKGKLPKATDNLQELISESSILVYACPSSTLREFLESQKNNPDFLSKDFINTAKGIDTKNNLLFDALAKNILGRSYWNEHFAVLSGPSFAHEILAGHPTCLTLAAKKRKTLKNIQNLIGTKLFRVYSCTDLKGVQLGGSVKNVIAIAAGIVEGLGLGMNTKAAIINLGLVEMSRLGRKMGAKTLTFRGFSGVGDLILTCTGPQSRNRRFGYLLGQGLSVDEAIKKINSTIEGIPTAKAVHKIALNNHLELPVCDEVFKIVHENKELHKGIEDLLSRPQLEEWR